MADTPEVNVPIRGTFDPAGTNAAHAAMGDLGAKAQEVGEHFTSLKFITEGLATALTGLTAAFGVFEIMKDGLEDAVKTEVAFRGIDAAAGRLGLSTGDAREKIETFSKALGEMGRVATGEVIASMSRLVTETGNYSEATARATLAMKIHANSTLTYEEALSMVEKATHGQIRGVQELTGVMIKSADIHEKAELAVGALEGKFRNLKATVDDDAGAMARSSAAWTNFKESVGSVLLEVIGWLIESIKEIPDRLKYMVDISAAIFTAMASHAGIAATFIKNAFTGSWSDAVAIADKAQKKVHENFLAAEGLANQDLENAGARRQAALDAQIAKELKGRVHANDVLKAGQNEVLRNEMSDQEAALRHADAVERELNAHYAEGVNKRLADARREENEEEALAKKKLEAMKKAIEEEERARKEAHHAELERRKAEIQAALQGAGIMVQIGADVFGNTKEVAIAGALVNAGSAVVSALAAPYPFDIILPILVAIEAAAQIAKIASAPPPNLKSTAGSGFDDAGNDQAAYLTGRKWAMDMVGKVSAGWQSGLGGLGGGGSTTNNSTSNVTHNYHIGGGILDPNQREGMKQFARQLAKVQQSDAQRTIARR